MGDGSAESHGEARPACARACVRCVPGLSRQQMARSMCMRMCPVLPSPGAHTHTIAPIATTPSKTARLPLECFSPIPAALHHRLRLVFFPVRHKHNAPASSARNAIPHPPSPQLKLRSGQGKIAVTGEQRGLSLGALIGGGVAATSSSGARLARGREERTSKGSNPATGQQLG